MDSSSESDLLNTSLESVPVDTVKGLAKCTDILLS